jgi:hypothetical protein
MEVLIRSSMLHSAYRERVALEEADFRLTPPVEGFTLMDFTRLDELAAVGYRHAQEAVRRWRDTGQWPPMPRPAVPA